MGLRFCRGISYLNDFCVEAELVETVPLWSFWVPFSGAVMDESCDPCASMFSDRMLYDRLGGLRGKVKPC